MCVCVCQQERLFMETQAERLEKHMRQLADQHRQKIALLESQFLQQKQQLLRGETFNTHSRYFVKV